MTEPTVRLSAWVRGLVQGGVGAGEEIVGFSER